jgi:hypothetical protein
MNVKVLSVAHHRNGICGEPFAAVVFIENDRRMVATIGFKGEAPDPITCRVLDIDMLTIGNIAFGQNSWRGDDYGDVLAPLVSEWLDRRHQELLDDIAAGVRTPVEVINLNEGNV